MDSNVTFARNLLKITFGIVPIVAGLDKFLNFLTDWSQYIPQYFEGFLPLGPETILAIVGVIEIAAGIFVFAKTKIGAYIVSAWLVLIGLILISTGEYYDVAVRDFVMAIAAISLAKLSEAQAGVVSGAGKASISFKDNKGPERATA